MDRNALRRGAVIGAVMLGVAAGSYGVANAASGSGGSSVGAAAASQSQSAPRGWGVQRSDETLLTGETKSKVEAAALAAVSGGTIVRVATDADGNAAYEAHMNKADGTPVTVYVNTDFDVVSVESR